MQPALAGCQSRGEVISWWERRGWSGWRQELVCGNVTPLAGPAAAAGGWWLVVGLLWPRVCLAHPLLGRGRGEDSRGRGIAQWEGSSLALSGFHCPSWLLARLPRLLGKGPCSLPQALHVGPRLPTRESRYRRASCLAPGALPGALRLSPSLPATGFSCWLSPPPAQVRGPGGACLVAGLDPDHKVRDRPGISGEMLLAKPRWLQGPDRKPPSAVPVASLPPPGQTPELRSGTAPRSSPRQPGPA